jgi:1-acyl-sn-glycerol-3-phosphate acyltransferase
MSPMMILLALALGWIVCMALIRLILVPFLRMGPTRDPLVGFLWWCVRIFAAVVHRIRFEGTGSLPAAEDHGGLIVVSNHTGAVDPLLIQAACRFHIRWMMASDMMIPALDWFWRQQRIIPVDREGRDTRSLREALRHVHRGGALGIFPEGRIVIPRGEIRPFLEGVGVVVARSRAPVLLVWVSGTPETNDTGQSLFTSSCARVVFSEPFDFGGERDAAKITQTLRRRLAEMSNWRLNDTPMPPADSIED